MTHISDESKNIPESSRILTLIVRQLVASLDSLVRSSSKPDDT